MPNMSGLRSLARFGEGVSGRGILESQFDPLQLEAVK